MWWRWQKIRRASITPELREHFELYGETLMALAVESGDANRIGEDLVKLGQQKRPEIVQWLRERRDIAARREDRVETVELAILLFVILGAIADIAILRTHR
jgi:hypothetical protein